MSIDSGTREDNTPITAEKQFKYACAYLGVMYGVSCKGVEPPTVVTSRVVDGRYYGFRYVGEKYIFINKRLWLHDRPNWESTVVHESVHYILDFAGADVSRCESEEIARRAHHSYERSKYSDEWRDRYKCPK